MGGSGLCISVVGKPVAYGIGFVVLVLVAFTGGFAASLVTVAHEGGHMAMGLLTGAGVQPIDDVAVPVHTSPPLNPTGHVPTAARATAPRHDC